MPLEKPKTSLAEAKRKAGLPHATSSVSETQPVVTPVTLDAPPSTVTEFKKVEPIRNKSAPSSKPRKPKKQVANSSNERSVRLQIELPAPAKGQSKVFDQLCGQVGVHKATLLLIKKSFDLLEIDFSENTSLPDMKIYDPSDEDVTTTRALSPLIWEKAIEKFDPLEFLPQRQIAKEIATYAVSRFMQREGK